MKNNNGELEMINVVNYLRVSTKHSDQRNSLENQKDFFEYYVQEHPNWNLVGTYIDEGITGTNTKKRVAFNQMIEDAKNKKFKMIITKEVSRFARNTLDVIAYTRMLKKFNIGVYFLLEDLNSLDENAENRLTDYASHAQDESHKTSRRVTWGIHNRMKQNFVFGNHVFGYDLKNGKLTINEEQAEVVKLIFKLYMEGKGINGIRKELESRAIFSPSGLTKWKDSSVQTILLNEKYMGTLKQHKEITVDYLEHTRIKNDGTEKKFLIKENNHNSIISKEDFEAVQEEMERRQELVTDKRKYSNRYCFSSKIICGNCGATFQRRYWNKKREQKNVVWQCKNNIYYGKRKIDAYGEEKGCDSKGIHEEILQSLFLVILNKVVDNKKQHIANLKTLVHDSISELSDNSKKQRQLESKVNKIENRRHKLLELYSDGTIKKEQFASSNIEYTSQIEHIKSEISNIQHISKKRDELTDKFKMIDKNIENIVKCTEFSDAVCSNVLEHVDVYNRDNIDFFFQINNNPIFFKLNIPVLSVQEGLRVPPGQMVPLDLPE